MQNDIRSELITVLADNREHWQKVKHEHPGQESIGFVNIGYRWLEVNEFLHVYTATSLRSSPKEVGLPQTEVLAYVQYNKKNGLYRALRSMHFTCIEMDISNSLIEDIKKSVEYELLTERLHFNNTIEED